jgi:hypothetical protein
MARQHASGTLPRTHAGSHRPGYGVQNVRKVPVPAVVKVIAIQCDANGAEIFAFVVRAFCYFLKIRELCAPEHLSGVNFDEFVLVDPQKTAEIIVVKPKVAS